MKNFGYEQLLFVRPAFARDAARPFAAHGVGVLEQARTTTFRELRRTFDTLVGTTAIRAKRPSNLVRTALEAGELARQLRRMTGRACPLLGRETTGMTNRELGNCDLVASISTGTAYPTLNISHALAIFLYELRRAEGLHPQPLAPRPQRVVTLAYFTKLAELSGFPRHKRSLLAQSFRRVLGGQVPRAREVSLLTGLLHRAVIALQKQVRYA